MPKNICQNIKHVEGCPNFEHNKPKRTGNPAPPFKSEASFTRLVLEHAAWKHMETCINITDLSLDLSPIYFS